MKAQFPTSNPLVACSNHAGRAIQADNDAE